MKSFFLKKKKKQKGGNNVVQWCFLRNAFANALPNHNIYKTMNDGFCIYKTLCNLINYFFDYMLNKNCVKSFLFAFHDLIVIQNCYYYF